MQLDMGNLDHPLILLPSLSHDLSQEKKLKNWYIQEYTTGTTFEPNISKKVTTTMVERVDMMKKQATVNTCYRMNSRNDRWMMRLKPIQVEFYSIENQKSYSNTM